MKILYYNRDRIDGHMGAELLYIREMFWQKCRRGMTESYTL